MKSTLKKRKELEDRRKAVLEQRELPRPDEPIEEEEFLSEAETVPVTPNQALVTRPVFDQNALLETNISKGLENETGIKSLSKEMYSKSNIDLKTEVSHNDANNITRCRAMLVLVPGLSLGPALDSLLGLRVSLERKGRGEFTTAIQGAIAQQNQVNAMGRAFGQDQGGAR